MRKSLVIAAGAVASALALGACAPTPTVVQMPGPTGPDTAIYTSSQGNTVAITGVR